MNIFQYIELTVCNGENIHPDLLRSTCNKRYRELCFTRQCIFYLMRRFTNESFLAIGKYYGKDHATVIYAEKAINNLIDTDKTVASKINIYYDKISMAIEYDFVGLIADINNCKKHLRDCINNDIPIDDRLINSYNNLLKLK